MRMMLRTILTAVVMVGVSSAAFGQTAFKYQFKPDSKLGYVMDMKMKMTMNVAGKEIAINQKMLMDVDWAIGKVAEDGTADVKITYGKTQMTMEAPFGNVEVSSDQTDEPAGPVGPILLKVVKAMAKFEANMKVAPNGEITDFKANDELAKELAQLPGADQVAKMLDSESMKSNIRDTTMLLPKTAVQKGSKWKQDISGKNAMGKVTGDREYTYEGSESRDGTTVEKFKVVPKMKVEVTVPNATIEMKKQEGAGTVYFDNAKGQIAEMISNQTVEMEVQVAGMTIEQKMDITNTLKRRK